MVIHVRNCDIYSQQLLSILCDDDIMNPKNLGFKNDPEEDPYFNTNNTFMMLSVTSQLNKINIDMIKIAS